ncbi:glycosyltransferase [Phyllobacterium leguminum]|uniref:Succinoglycan biosynthesis protein ExoM n=1 Tax=Phyllobacterium leguminum TaxID=314237 RepID=A0A318TIG0_9HYPH|nr:glycosyltransferase family 2 protein [Phyllobacterium leguminum]PYE88806.1 succinoglycan biosynthesis protein ExoM [Phyllobacterium leguminum]
MSKTEIFNASLHPRPSRLAALAPQDEGEGRRRSSSPHPEVRSEAKRNEASKGEGARHAFYRIDIGVCTYRRKELEATLHSLGRLNVPENCRVRIIVADNDVNPSAKERVADIAPSLPFELTYIHCPASNISIARNACLDASDGDFLAFIDDDETACEDWLAYLMATAQDRNADAVLGPVRASYGEGAPRWMSKGDFHSTFPVWVKGEIRTGYTCNVLLRNASPAVAGRRFSLALGRSGGEDTQYFSELYEAGGKIAYAREAWVYEPVPAGRARFSWLCKRRFRFGQTHGRLLAGKAVGLGLAKQVALAAAKAVYSFGAALVTAFSATHRNRSLLRGIMHVGVISGLMGIREIQQYGEAAMAPASGGKSHAA